MVLTRRAHRDISRRLPNEIITEIVQAARRSDQASLCRISQLFYAVSLPVLYRDVRMETAASALAFRSSVMSNNVLAELVRSYAVVFPILPRPGPLLVDSIEVLTRLQDLSILSFSVEAHFEELLGWTFPHLAKCRLLLATQKPNLLVSFLLRHPGLKILCIQDHHEMVSWPSTARIPLLNLTQLWCPVTLVPSIITHNLKRAKLCWNDHEVDPSAVEKTFVALKSMSRPDAPFVCSNSSSDHYFTEIMHSISKHMPHTTTLQLTLWSPDDISSHFTDGLPRSNSLAFLSLQYMEPLNHPDHAFWNNEEDQTVVHSMGDACPTLQALRLHQRAWRKVDQTWETYPVEDFEVLAGLSKMKKS
ncbi:hypothetical protein B0H17DRAFT_1338296 [Mycena rosella]|uniref:Uncharacterized protein n=1 Tax=Mycena rosella TaxID=1033263 RepID=A0AAD7CN25_MYCRO|nr:hypothetical protein B0H17DRAFT_1338296 [Mycena rosella]